MVSALVKHLVVDVDFVEIERDVLLRFPVDLFLKLARRHQRHGDFLDDDAVPARAKRDVSPLGLGEELLEPLDHGARVDDVAVDDGLGRKRMKPEPCDGSCPPAPLFDFTDLDRARTDVDAD